MVMQQTPKQPGLFAQMATTAAGVAVGSTVGHVIGAAITGGGSSQAPAPAAAAPVQQPPQYQQQPQQQNPCWQQMQQFLDCTSQNSDISYCQNFNEAFKDCKTRYGLY